MIRLSLLTEPVDIDLSGIYPGVKVRLKRLTAMDWEEARGKAATVLKSAESGLEALADYGLNATDANGVRLSAVDLGQMTWAGFLVGCVELCLLGLISWEGVEVDEGVPAPITRETLSILLQDRALCQRLLNELTDAARILISEGKDLAGSQDGSSVTRPQTTGGQTIAEAVGLQASPAPTASPGSPGATARKSNTRRKP